VTAFAIEPGTGRLRELNAVNSRGAGPAHLSVDATGKFAFVANYIGGSIAVLPILADGRLEQACFVHQDSGAVGPKQAASGPPGSFAVSGHDAPHAHMIQADPQNRFPLYADLGQDRNGRFLDCHIRDWADGMLRHLDDTPAGGDYPRHIALGPRGWFLYACNQRSDVITSLRVAEEDGRLTFTGRYQSVGTPNRLVFAG
jgi:6-phosphogluconolactonase (cycloisomerase 2 family)